MNKWIITICKKKKNKKKPTKNIVTVSTFQKINSFSVNSVVVLQLCMHIVPLRENICSKCLPTLCEHASENLNSLPRSVLICLHYILPTAVDGNHYRTKGKKKVNEDDTCIWSECDPWINWVESQVQNLGWMLNFACHY